MSLREEGQCQAKKGPGAQRPSSGVDSLGLHPWRAESACVEADGSGSCPAQGCLWGYSVGEPRTRLIAPLASEPKWSGTLSMLNAQGGRDTLTLTRAAGKNCGSPPCFPPICPLLSLEASQRSGSLQATAPFHCEANQGQEKARFCP